MNLGLSLGLGARGASGYSPVVSLGNVVLWLRGDLGITSVGGKCTGWADQSGIGDANRNFAPPGTDKPAWNASDATYNGQASVGTFNFSSGANDCRLANPGAWNATYTTFSLIVVGHSTGASGPRYFTSSIGADRISVAKNSSGKVEFITGAGTEVGTTTVDSTVPRLMIAEVNGTTASLGKMYADSVSSSTAMTASGSLGANPFNLGTLMISNLATTWGVDAIAEVIVVNALWSGLAAQKKTDFAAYINARYAKAVT